MNTKALIVGAVFGLIAPFIGIFFGLQVSVLLGNILAFPVVGLAYVLGQPFGTWHPAIMVLAVILSVVAWAVIFGVIAKLLVRKPDAKATPLGVSE